MRQADPDDRWLSTLLVEDAIYGVPDAAAVDISAVRRRLGQARFPKALVSIALIFLIVALAVLLEASPVGAGLSRKHLPLGMQQLFGLVATKSQPSSAASTPVLPPEILSNGPGWYDEMSTQPVVPNLTLTQAEGRVGYPIPNPRYVPTGWHFSGAFVAPDGSILLAYAPPSGSNGSLLLELRKGRASGGYVVPQSEVTSVTISGHPGALVRGGWAPNRSWDANKPGEILSWEDNSFTYVLQVSNTNLAVSVLVRIASSVS